MGEHETRDYCSASDGMPHIIRQMWRIKSSTRKTNIPTNITKEIPMEITLIFCEHCYDFILEEEALYLEELPYCIECVDAVSSNTN